MLFKFGKVVLLTFLLLATFSLEGQQYRASHEYNMLISHKKEFVYFKVFKVASRTTQQVLEKNISDIIQTRAHHIPTRLNQYFKFAFVRNPWDRVVSCYFHKVVNKMNMDFQECFDKDFEYFVDFINDLNVASPRTNPHIRLQTKLIPVKKLDFIGKLDNFAEDFQHICQKIGIKHVEIPHKHKTEHAHYSSYYTPRTRDIIAKKYKADIEAFGFTFEDKN